MAPSWILDQFTFNKISSYEYRNYKISLMLLNDLIIMKYAK